MAALGTGLLWVRLGTAGDPGVQRPGWLLVEWMNGRAASPPEGLLLSLGVEGHVPTVTASGQDGPEGGNESSFTNVNFFRGKLIEFKTSNHRAGASPPTV